MIKIRKLCDAHVHLRQDNPSMLKQVVNPTAKVCKHAVVMPNTVVPIIFDDDVLRSRKEILKFSNYPDFEPLIMMEMQANCTPDIIRKAKIAGAIGSKSYPKGVTTNSKDGLTEEILNNPPQNLLDCWEEQSKNGMISSWHGEMPNSFVMDGEKDFLPFISNLANCYPNLKIVLEHISTKDAVDLILNKNPHNNIAATITYHHLVLTLDDVLKYNFRPHSYCKPIAKTPNDRVWLINAALSGHPNFFLGSDSAPHYRHHKECVGGCAGIYSSPVLVEGLADFFESHHALDKMENFVSVFGPRFYGLPLSTEYITLIKKSWTVPYSYNNIVPFLAGEMLNWSVEC